MIQDREDIVLHINDARAAGARQLQACDIIGISAKTYQRWTKPDNVEDGRLDTRQVPGNKLSKLEC